MMTNDLSDKAFWEWWATIADTNQIAAWTECRRRAEAERHKQAEEYIGLIGNLEKQLEERERQAFEAGFGAGSANPGLYAGEDWNTYKKKQK